MIFISDTLNIDEIEELKRIDPSEYFVSIGKQYAPMMRKLLSLMVTATAAHGASMQFSPLFRKGIFYASNLFYLLNGKAAADKAAHFMSNLTVEAGKALWTMPETNELFRKASFMTYPDIELSAVFKVTNLYRKITF